MQEPAARSAPAPSRAGPFVMTGRIGQRRLDGTMDVEAILVTPGEAFGRFLLGPGRQLALLSSETLRYDPYRQRPEKRLARYLWQWRVGAHSGDFIRTYRESTLLHELGLQVEEQKPTRTRERASRVRTRTAPWRRLLRTLPRLLSVATTSATAAMHVTMLTTCGPSERPTAVAVTGPRKRRLRESPRVQAPLR
jgi:hypothetical protein